ncbi:S-formylglutathione hydrolase [Legionella dresdenensis]|uniref:S-formylglutathione hydrolase n=1 Tax=Legionella dresdenensis TaxID=450200 RepID=A0ABV8CF03_9GAMM
MTINVVEEHRCFGGTQYVYQHDAESTQCQMRFAVYLPPAAATAKVPAVFWLSGLTCSEQNFITKAGAQRIASALGLALIVPDTSPRNVNLNSNTESDVGEGAGFYVNATQAPWEKHYQMYRYISQELPGLIAAHLPIDTARLAISGHSMGGHGALVIALRNPELFHCVSTFAPICSSSRSPWGKKALTAYLGNSAEAWQDYDACHLMEKYPWPNGKILIDQGSLDPFLKTELKPELFKKACDKAGVELNLRIQNGYDHSYYFVASFIEEHLRAHAQCLQ